MKTYHSFSSEETKKFGAKLAKELSVSRASALPFRRGRSCDKTEALKTKLIRLATILALRGDLGSGKTTFTQGFLRGLGVKGRVNSPTFVLMKRFKLKNRRFKNAYHIDCYRVKKSSELLSLGLKEIFSNSENIVLIEWPERISRILPKRRINLVFNHEKDMRTRKIKVI